MQEWFDMSKQVVFEPKTFFDETETHEGYGYAIKFAVTSGVIFSVLSMLVSLVQSVAVGTVAPKELMMLALGPVLSPIFAVIGLMLGTAVFHALIYLLGGRGTHKTADIVAYTSAVQAFFGWIPIVNIFAGLYGLYLYIIGFKDVHDLSTARAAVAVLVPVFVFLAIMILLMVLLVALRAPMTP